MNSPRWIFVWLTLCSLNTDLLTYLRKCTYGLCTTNEQLLTLWFSTLLHVLNTVQSALKPTFHYADFPVSFRRGDANGLVADLSRTIFKLSLHVEMGLKPRNLPVTSPILPRDAYRERFGGVGVMEFGLNNCAQRHTRSRTHTINQIHSPEGRTHLIPKWRTPMLGGVYSCRYHLNSVTISNGFYRPTLCIARS